MIQTHSLGVKLGEDACLWVDLCRPDAKELDQASEQAGFWTLQAGIFPENGASLALHRACGFREVGYRERIGQMDGRWRDTVLLERRSPVVGL